MFMQGEEIGMTDVWLSWEDTVDPQVRQTRHELTFQSKMLLVSSFWYFCLFHMNFIVFSGLPHR